MKHYSPLIAPDTVNPQVQRLWREQNVRLDRPVETLYKASNVPITIEKSGTGPETRIVHVRPHSGFAVPLIRYRHQLWTMLTQWNHAGTAKRGVQFPARMVGENETVLQAAARAMRDETLLGDSELRSTRYVGGGIGSPGSSNEQLHHFVFEVESSGDPMRHHGEIIRDEKGEEHSLFVMPVDPDHPVSPLLVENLADRAALERATHMRLAEETQKGILQPNDAIPDPFTEWDNRVQQQGRVSKTLLHIKPVPLKFSISHEPDGGNSRCVLLRPPSIFTIPVIQTRQGFYTVLTNEFRPGPVAVTTQFPAETGKIGATYSNNAARALLEETTICGDHWEQETEFLTHGCISPGGSNEQLVYFMTVFRPPHDIDVAALTRSLDGKDTGCANENEFIRTTLVPFDSAILEHLHNIADQYCARLAMRKLGIPLLASSNLA